MIDEKIKNPRGSNALRKHRAIMTAQSVICVSENTKKDLLEIVAIPEDRIKVIYHGSDIDEKISYGRESVPRSPYYLYVGSRAKYKNFNGLLTAFKKAVSVSDELSLCIVGPEFRDEERALISALGLANNISHYGVVNDRHLAKIYRCSQALVYPSFYEGFGIPLLEAMSCGTAVIASNTSSIPEVVGDAGVLFDPNAADDLADILISFSSNQTEREGLVTRGRARAALFSWDKTAEETLSVYRSLI
jgi:glycosyltransferase involved in cell wall biosynthesis